MAVPKHRAGCATDELFCGAVYEGTDPPAWVPTECDTTFTAAFICRASAGRRRKPDHHPAAFRPPEPVVYKPLPPDDIQSPFDRITVEGAYGQH